MPYEGWPTEELSDQGLKAFFDASRQKWEAGETEAHKRARHCLYAAGVFAVIGVLGMGSALVTNYKEPPPPPFGYIAIDKFTGAFQGPVSVTNAPLLYNESVRRAAIVDFITNCEGYTPQTWATIQYHACMVMATKDEQQRRMADIGTPNSPHYPPAIFGLQGWAAPTDFPSFVTAPINETKLNQTFSYQVRYTRTEVIAGHQQNQRYVAQIAFQFHPELRMSDADRLINQSGLQVVSFSTIKE